MTSKHSIDPGLARQDMITDEVAHDALAGEVWRAVNQGIGATKGCDYAAVIIINLLRSMQDTHGSMRAIYTAAQKIEETTNEPTGRWADMLVLARAQFDAVFIGILLAHDPARWGPRYYKAGWATDALCYFYEMRRFKNTPCGRAVRNRNIYRLKVRARAYRVTTKEWLATLAHVRGINLRFGATPNDRIKAFPTPGQIVKERLLAKGVFEDLGKTLWVHWKFLCDPAHGGMRTLVLRHQLREEELGTLGKSRRQEMIDGQVARQSLIPSLVAILTLTTVLTTFSRDNTELLANVTKAWETLDKGTFEGGIVWEKWASKALGVLQS